MITLAKIKRFRRFFARHRVLLYVESVLVWLVIVAAIFYAISFFVIPSVAEANLQKLCGGAVDIRSGRFKGFGAIRLNGIVVAEDSRAILKTPILQADQIDLRFDFRQLLKGRFAPSSVRLSGFLLTADYDRQQRKWNLANLSFQKHRSHQQTIPLVHLERGTLRVRQADGADIENLLTVGLGGTLAEQTTKNKYRFSIESDGRFGFDESKLQGDFQLGGEGKQSLLFVTGRIKMPDNGVLQNKWDMKDLYLHAAFDEKMIAIKRFGFSMGPGSGKIDGVIHRTGNRPMELNIGLHGLTLSDRSDPGTISYGGLLESSDSGFARFLRRFRPAGAGELDLSIKAELDDLSQARLDGLILCKDISICDEQFPYRIEKMQGDIEFTGRTIRLKQIQARHGDIHLLIDGQLANFGPQVAIEFRVTSKDMRFDDDMYQSLSEKAKKAWYDFTPEGLAESDYYFQRTPDGQEKKEVTLNLKNVSATYKHFPYPLKNITGKVVLRPQQLLIEDVLASYDNGSQLKVAGRVLQQEKAEPVFDVRIQGEDIPIDQQLIKALPPRYGTFFEHLQADETDAIADFVVTVFPDKTDKRFLDYSADIKVKADAFQLDAFPLPMTDVELAATVTEDMVRLDSFRAQTESGPIHIGESRLWSQGADPNRPGICLALDLKDFDLNETFWGAVGPDARRKLGKLGIRGQIDAKGKLAVNVPKEGCGENDLAVNFHDNPLTMNGTTLGRAGGRLHIRDDRVLFSGFQVVDISLESLSKELASEKTGPLPARINPKGEVSVYLEDGFLKIGSQGPESIVVGAKLSAHDLSFGQTGDVSGLDGDCGGPFAFDFETGRWQAEARYDIGQFMCRDRIVTGLRGDLVFDPNAMRLQSDGFSAALCDGVVTGNLKIDLHPEQAPRYQLELNYDGVDVQTLLAAGGTAPPQQAAQGLAAGRLALEGDVGDFSTSRGTFETTIVDLEMGRQSLLGKILTAVQLRRSENFVFSEIDLSVAVLGPELVFDRIRMLGNPLIFHGQGRANLQSRQIEIELASWNRKNGSEETILDALARGIGSALWKVQVRGTLDTPEVDAVYLSVLKQPLDIFKDPN